MNEVNEIFKFGGMEVKFHLKADDTNDQLTMFKCTIPAGTKMAVPHFHEHFDEAVYGLKGTITYIVNGKTIELGPGEHLFVRRGHVHAFTNKTDETVEFLCVATPAVFGPEYFRDLTRAFVNPGPPDLAMIAEVMKKHGLVPVPEQQLV